jgi:hypothetical protein
MPGTTRNDFPETCFPPRDLDGAQFNCKRSLVFPRPVSFRDQRRPMSLILRRKAA